MYKGFNLRLIEEDIPDFDIFVKEGKKSYSSRKKGISDEIKSFRNSDGTIDASKMQRGWFPRTPTSIFLSHSHVDESLAIAFAAWIKRCFNLDVFIDSCLWGNSATLLQLLDDTYCKKTNSNTYDYDRRNLTTSHVHMMLQTALADMIDNTECVIFLNTPNSISPEEVLSKTYSPWIYSELTTTSIVRNRTINDYRTHYITERRQFSKGGVVVPKFTYNAPVEHLTKLDVTDLKNWCKIMRMSKKAGNPMHGLDALYRATKQNGNIYEI